MAKNEETNESKTDEQSAERAKSQDAASAPRSDADAPLNASDLEGLDLTIETVEERISPSETNVFDK